MQHKFKESNFGTSKDIQGHINTLTFAIPPSSKWARIQLSLVVHEDFIHVF